MSKGIVITVENKSKENSITGEITGKGELFIKLDADNLFKLTADYATPDKLVLSFGAGFTWQLDKDSQFKLSGGLQYDMFDGTASGNLGAEIIIDRDIAAKIEQSFNSQGGKTTLQLKIRF